MPLLFTRSNKQTIKSSRHQESTKISRWVNFPTKTTYQSQSQTCWLLLIFALSAAPKYWEISGKWRPFIHAKWSNGKSLSGRIQKLGVGQFLPWCPGLQDGTALLVPEWVVGVCDPCHQAVVSGIGINESHHSVGNKIQAVRDQGWNGSPEGKKSLYLVSSNRTKHGY